MNEIIYKNSPEYLSRAKKAQKTAKVLSKNAAEQRRKLLLGGLAALLGAGLLAGGYFLSDINSDWYADLYKPFFCPPLYVLYVLYGIAVVCFSASYALILIRYRGLIIKFEYLFNSLLQLLWMIFYYRIHAVFGALVILSLLVVHTFFLLKYTRQHIGNIGLLLIAHLIRVVFSLLLNYSILILN